MPTRTELLVGVLILFGTSLALLAAVAVLVWWQRWREGPRHPRARSEREYAARRAAAVAEQAAAVATAAEHARQRAAAAEQAREQAFEELTRAQQEHDRAAEDFHQLAQQRVEQAGDATGQRELSRAAYAAYRRGDLSQEQLWRVWRLGSGWDPGLEQREQQLMRLRAARRDAQTHYRAAANRARVAAQQAEIADEQARDLIEEAADVAQHSDVTA